MLALILGLAAGRAVGHPVEAAGVVAALWVNALRMTVLPLVTALLVTSTGALRPAESGQRVGRALLLFAAMLTGAVAIAAAVAVPAFMALDIPAVEREALRAQWGAQPSLGRAPSFAAWVVSVIPVNPVTAAAEGNLLAVIVFALALGLALAALPVGQAAPVLAFFHGVAGAMQVVLAWVLRVAALGVFALGFQMVAAGRSVAGALGQYVLVTTAIFLLVLAAVYVSMALTRPVPWSAFVRAAAPAQLVAFTSRSSLAALPLLVQAAQRLPLHAARAGLLLPLAMSLLRISAPASQLAALLFAAKLSGVTLQPASIALAGGIAVLLSFSVPGIPNASFLVMMPLFTTMGVPVEAIGLLLAVDLVPDLVKGVANVTAHLAAVCLLARK